MSDCQVESKTTNSKKGELKQNNNDIIKLLIFLFTIFLYLFIICYNEAFFSVFSFPYERAALPINFYLLNILRVLFLNFTFYILWVLLIAIAVTIGIIAIFVINIAAKGSNTSNLSILSIYKSNKLLLLFLAWIITFGIMWLAYYYRDLILNKILEIFYSLSDYSEIKFYLLISFYIFVCFEAFSKKDRLIESIKYILFVDVDADRFLIFLCLNKYPKLFIHSFVLLFFIGFIFFNDALIVEIGTEDAISLVQGKPPRFEGDPGRYELKLAMNESDNDLTNKSLIFFMLQDGIYYFVEKQGPEFGKDHQGNYTSVHAVPSSKVKLASLTLIKSEDNRKSLVSGSI